MRESIQPTDLPRENEYRYVVEFRFGSWSHRWEIIGRHGAVHFHHSYNPKHTAEYGPVAGLETHYRQPPPYMNDRAPSHSPCQLLGAPCWHDGTSLYASEKLLPLVDWHNPLEFFSHLVGEMKRLESE